MPRLISALEQLFATDSLSGGPYLALNYSSLTGSFSIAETITGGTSGATAVIQNNITPQITCRTVSGEFQIGETITGGTSGATATLDNFFLYDFPNGASPLENGLIDFFESGSSTVRKTTYSDVAETIPNANPLVINGDGRVPNVYGTGSYRVVVRTTTGVQMFARDPVGGDQGFTFGSDWSSTTTYAATDVVRDAGSYWLSLVSSNQNNQPSTDVGVNWLEVPFVDITTNTTNIAANTAGISTIPEYAANGDFYTDSGAADAYVLSTVDGKQAPTAYKSGQRFRFVTSNPNGGGAATVNVAGLGVKSIKLRGGADPAAGDIDGRTKLVYDLANDWMELQRDNAIGVNQTRQSFTSPTRQAGVTYTNTTGRTISLSINAYHGAGGGSTAGLELLIDGVRQQFPRMGVSTQEQSVYVSDIILNGETYQVDVFGSSAIDFWNEVR